MTLQTSIKDAGRIFKMYAGRLEKLDISTLEDLLYHIPFRYDDYSLVSKINTLQVGEVVTIQGTITEIKNTFLRSHKALQKATIQDETGELQITWFNQAFLTRAIKSGDIVGLSGRVALFGKKLTLQSPDYEILNGTKSIHTGRLVPIYPETKGVSSKWLRRQIYGLLQDKNMIPDDFLPADIQKRNNLIPLARALQNIHFPDSISDSLQAHERLAFDELFLLQIKALRKRKEWEKEHVGKGFLLDEIKIQSLVKSLPFELTESQLHAIHDIQEDLVRTKPMNRLLQGDVGSGKTVVSAIGMYIAYLNGYQSLLMAPTEILANQHFATISQFLSPFGVTVDLVTGSKNSVKKTDKSHHTDVLVGTHALLNDKVTLDNLGLIIIDEQQRFGVEQRGRLRTKGDNPHILTMTATPIPRTIALTLYGELDLSYLSQMPQGRKKIKTWLVPEEKRSAGYEWIRKEISENKSQAFIICPFIEESENMTTVKAAAKEFERLKNDVFPDLRLALLHGKQKGKEKDLVLQEFKEGKYDILVATPVVEVGIDIPNATIIVIEAAERFGLAQLHQLRGRVGRGDKQSYCLLYTEATNPSTIQRLKAMETSHVGAELAELDFKMRGPGEIFGTLQHGSRKLKIANFLDIQMLERTKQEALSILPKIAANNTLTSKLEEKENKTISRD